MQEVELSRIVRFPGSEKTTQNLRMLKGTPIWCRWRIWLTDAIQKLAEVQTAYEFEEQRVDVDEKFGFIKTTIEFALKHSALRDQLFTR